MAKRRKAAARPRIALPRQRSQAFAVRTGKPYRKRKHKGRDPDAMTGGRGGGGFGGIGSGG